MVARSLIVAAAALVWLGGQASHAQEAHEDEDQSATVAIDPRLVEVRFTDGSRLKAMLADQVVEVETTHGRLKIPAEDVRAIEFAQRPSASFISRMPNCVVSSLITGATILPAALVSSVSTTSRFRGASSAGEYSSRNRARSFSAGSATSLLSRAASWTAR